MIIQSTLRTEVNPVSARGLPYSAEGSRILSQIVQHLPVLAAWPTGLTSRVFGGLDCMIINEMITVRREADRATRIEGSP